MPSHPIVVPEDPPTGTKGKAIILETNYLKLNLDRFFKKPIFQYDVVIEPLQSKRSFPKIMEKFQEEHYPEITTAFDGSKFLLSPLKFDTEYCGEVAYLGETYNVTLKFTKPIDLSFFENYKKNPNLKLHMEACQVLSIILRGYPIMRHLPVGRHFYKRPDEIIDLTNGMQLLYGLFQAPVLTQRGPMLNVNVLHKANPIVSYPDDIKLLDLICDICQIKNPQTNIELTDSQIKDILKVIHDKKVRYTVKGQTRKYTVKGFKGSPIQEVLSNDKKTTIEEYFAKEKRHKIKYRNLQLLWVGTREILIPVELCIFIGNQQKVNAEDYPDVVRNIISKTIVSTASRKQKILEMVDTIGNYKESPFLKEFGIEVGTKFEAVRGRILEPPRLKYSETVETVSRGKWECRGRFLKPVEINTWTVINLDQGFPYSKIKRFMDEVSNFNLNYKLFLKHCGQMNNLFVYKGDEISSTTVTRRNQKTVFYQICL